MDQSLLYDADPHVAELYDATENRTDDLEFLRRLVSGKGPLRILEAFCGTGRLLIPLAMDGHTVIGMDASRVMLARAGSKAAAAPAPVRARIALTERNVLHGGWPGPVDLVILAGNCFYELATPEDQEACICMARECLGAGGRVYVDNDHMDGDLAASWQDTAERACFPSGTCADGTRLESSIRTVWFDAPKRLVRFERTTRATTTGGMVSATTCIQQKHPLSMPEVQGWLIGNGFRIEAIFGDRSGTPYAPELGRAVFWACTE
jgi:SAM-dependent methyltransferase